VVPTHIASVVRSSCSYLSLNVTVGWPDITCSFPRIRILCSLSSSLSVADRRASRGLKNRTSMIHQSTLLGRSVWFFQWRRIGQGRWIVEDHFANLSVCTHAKRKEFSVPKGRRVEHFTTPRAKKQKQKRTNQQQQTYS
jgi:hypothetical protein